MTSPASNFRAVLKGLTILNGYSGTHSLNLDTDASLGRPRIAVRMGGVTIDEHHTKQMTALGWRKSALTVASIWLFEGE